MAQPDAWAAYQQVTRAAPKDAPLSLREQYRDLDISLVLKAALKCSPDALALMAERQDVITFRVLQPTNATACKTGGRKREETKQP